MKDRPERGGYASSGRLVSELPPPPASLCVPAEPRPTAESLRAAIRSITSRITTSAMDYGDYEPNAWVYGIAVGWDCEEDHDHDDICGGTGAMEELAARFGWDESAVARLRAHRRAYADAASES